MLLLFEELPELLFMLVGLMFLVDGREVMSIQLSINCD
jgi:hypothetical protein